MLAIALQMQRYIHHIWQMLYNDLTQRYLFGLHPQFRAVFGKCGGSDIKNKGHGPSLAKMFITVNHRLSTAVLLEMIA